MTFPSHILRGSYNSPKKLSNLNLFLEPLRSNFGY